MNGRDIYLRHTDTAGKNFVQSHRVWDAERFIASQQAEADRLNREAVEKKLPAKAKVEQITQDMYREERAAA